MTPITDERLEKFFEDFKTKKIMVIGDLMLDRYVEGTVNRISPEAPVPVVEVTSEFTRLGGAANVAYNLCSLRATPVVVGVVGNDWAGEKLIELMKNLGFVTDYIIHDENRPTVVKTRIIADNQHVVRADRESKETIGKEIISKAIAAVKENINHVDAVIIQDYNKGFLTEELITQVIGLANQADTIITVDPKFDNFFHYKSVTLFKPNLKETESALGIKISSSQDLKNACKLILDRLQCKSILITLGEQGMCYLDSEGKFTQTPTKARKVHDVSGAGDTVISTLTLALAAGANIKEAITLANYAAGAVCGEVGVVPIEPLKLKEAIHNFK